MFGFHGSVLTPLMCVQQTGYHITSLSTHTVLSLSLQAVSDKKQQHNFLLLPLCSFWTARGDGGGKPVSSM